jgi:hypothetical protein
MVQVAPFALFGRQLPEAQYAVPIHCPSAVQVVPQEDALAQAKFPRQACDEAGQLLMVNPSHWFSVNIPFVQLGAAHCTPLATGRQAPLAPHLF